MKGVKAVDRKQNLQKDNQNLSKNMSDMQLLKFIEQIEDEELIQAPWYLGENIIEKSHSFEVQLPKQAKYTASKVQFWLYSLKISAAIVAAVYLLFFINSQDFTSISYERENESNQFKYEQLEKERSLGKYMNQKSEKLGDAIGEFSNELLKIIQ